MKSHRCALRKAPGGHWEEDSGLISAQFADRPAPGACPHETPGVQASALVGSRRCQHLGGTQHLPETLVLTKVRCRGGMREGCAARPGLSGCCIRLARSFSHASRSFHPSMATCTHPDGPTDCDHNTHAHSAEADDVVASTRRTLTVVALIAFPLRAGSRCRASTRTDTAVTSPWCSPRLACMPLESSSSLAVPGWPDERGAGAFPHDRDSRTTTTPRRTPHGPRWRGQGRPSVASSARVEMAAIIGVARASARAA